MVTPLTDVVIELEESKRHTTQCSAWRRHWQKLWSNLRSRRGTQLSAVPGDATDRRCDRTWGVEEAHNSVQCLATPLTDVVIACVRGYCTCMCVCTCCFVGKTRKPHDNVAYVVIVVIILIILLLLLFIIIIIIFISHKQTNTACAALLTRRNHECTCTRSDL